MAGQEPYGLLRCAIQITNDATLAYPARLRSLVTFIADAVGALSATIYLSAPDRKLLHQRISTTGPARLAGCAIPFGAGVAGACALEGSIVKGNHGKRHPEEVVTQPASAIVALPIGESGVLAIETSEDTIPPLLPVLEDIVPAIDGVIQRLTISDASRRRVRTLAALGEIGQTLNRPLLPRKLISLLLQAIQKNAGSCGTIIRLTEGSNLPHGVFTKFRRRVQPYRHELEAHEHRIASRALARGKTVVHQINRRGELPPSLICTPLRIESRILGTLTIVGKQCGDGQLHPFDNEDREFCENIATIASSCLASAANYQESMRLSTANDKRLRELSLLYRLSDTMLGTVSVNKLIHLTLTALTSGSSAIFERAMLFMINERSGTIQGMLGIVRDESVTPMMPVLDHDDPLTRRWDISDEAMARQIASEFSRRVRETRLPLDRNLNITSRAILDRKLVHVPDASREPLADREFTKRFGISSFAVAPLIAREKVVGVVVVDNPNRQHAIGRNELRILKLMASQAGKAIENAILYHEIEEAGRTLGEVQERVIQSERLAAIGEMAAGIAHELKGPLVSIGGFARRLEKKLAHDSQELESVDIIIREVMRLELMLSDILSFSRKTTICYEKCDIVTIVDHSLKLAKEQIARHGITLERHKSAGIPQILGDAQQLKQVFLNLFINAVEAMHEGGTLEVMVERTTMDETLAVAVVVSDTGGGIPLEMLHDIFSPFFTTKQGGTGLGLPIVHKIVTQHGGRINVCNRGHGAEFRVILPEHP